MPQLYDDLIPYWAAFQELSMTRPVGMGVGAIPFQEIVAWLDLHQITSLEDRLEYAKWVRYLDGVFLEHHAKQQQSEPKSSARGINKCINKQ